MRSIVYDAHKTMPKQYFFSLRPERKQTNAAHEWRTSWPIEPNEIVFFTVHSKFEYFASDSNQRRKQNKAKRRNKRDENELFIYFALSLSLNLKYEVIFTRIFIASTVCRWNIGIRKKQKLFIAHSRARPLSKYEEL